MSRHKLVRMFGYGLLVLVAGSAAHAQLAEFTPADKDFHERLDEHGRVSGDIFMGVMIGPVEPGTGDAVTLADTAPGRTADVEVRRLPFLTPSGTDERPKVCVRINSKDGRLEAVNTYFAEPSPGKFPYRGTYGDRLAEMPAVSLVRVGRCGDRSNEVVPSVWNGSAGLTGDEALHVFANTAGNPAVLVVGNDDGFVPCENVADPSTLKYTAACIVRFDLIERYRTNGRVLLTLLVARSLGEDRHDITVILPDEEG